MNADTSADLTRIHAIVSGRVQGVGFRFFTHAVAIRYNLTGWVKNQPNGNVEIEVQGPRHSVDSFIAEIRKGPQLSNVASVKTSVLPLHTNEQLFCIRY